MSDHATAAIRLAVEATSQATAIEKENEELQSQFKTNASLIASLDAASTHARFLQQQLREKQGEVEQKKKDLIALQGALISTLKNPPQADSSVEPASLEVIPIVMNSVLKYVTDLTEEAINENAIGVPILSLFKTAEALNNLFGALATKHIIQENDEEKHDRVQLYVSAQHEILTQLRNTLTQKESPPSGDQPDQETAGDIPPKVVEEPEPQ
jgi:hypothetical protein